MIKARPLKTTPGGGFEDCSPEKATRVRLHFPGPFAWRVIPVITSGKREGTPNWTWNGDVENPTLRPSVLTRISKTSGEDIVCHSQQTNGKVRFLTDCTHGFAGQTLDLLEASSDEWF